MTCRMLLLTLVCVSALGVGAIAQNQPQLPSIYSMVVGQETWELVDNRQITFAGDGKVTEFTISPDGRQVAYLCETPEGTDLCLANTGGGRPVAVIKTLSDERAKEAGIKEMWTDESSLVWSPNSKMLAFCATRCTDDGWADYVVVLNSNGSQRTALPLEERKAIYLDFSPDSRKLNVVTDYCSGATAAYYEPDYRQDVYDITSSRAKMISSGPPPEDWNQQFVDNADFLSPDGSMSVYAAGAGIFAKNTKTGKSTQVATAPSAKLSIWLLGSKLVSYTSPVSVSPDKQKENSSLDTLWLLNPVLEKNNTMCVALDIGDYCSPSWSSDCTRVAYTSRWRLFVAEITKRPPNAYEKAAAGLPLNEEELKTVLGRYAGMICIALEQYSMDRQGLPTSMEDFTGYVSSDVFYKPGTGEQVFEFGGESADGRQLLGKYDAGYDWVIEVYQSGWVETVVKP